MSDSNSNTSTETNQTDNRMVLGEGSINAGGGSTVNNTTTTNNTVSDSGAISDAFKFGNNALDFAGNTVDRSLQFAERNTNRVLDFAGTSQERSYAFATAANNRAASAIAQAGADSMAFAAQTSAQSTAAQRAALEVAQGSMSEALAFGGRQTAVALDSLNGSANLVKDAYSDAKGRGALTDKILMVAIAMAGVIAFTAVKR